jgi:hypothetical protein
MRLVDMTLGAVFGGGLVGTWLQLRHQRSVERNRRRERAAEVLAPMMKLLGEIRPYWWDTPEPNRQLVSDYKKRWEELREPFLVVAAAQPSPAVQDLAHKVDAAMGDTIALVDWLVEEKATKSDYAKQVLDESLEQHAKTHNLLSDLLKAI